MSPRSATERRAARLVRCYPPAWRERYGEEFLQHLLDEAEERPFTSKLVADVLWNAALAHAGALRKHTVTAAIAGFMTLGVALWSQLAVGWRWAPPASAGARAGMVLMSAGLLASAALGLIAALLFLANLVRALVRVRSRALVWPLVALCFSAALLVVGSLHFGHHWPGSGGHRSSPGDLIPTSIARASWAVTSWITSYWAHPHALARFPASEIAWMLACPVALLTGVLAGVRLAYRIGLPRRLARVGAFLGIATTLSMAVFLAGAIAWVVGGVSAARLFHVGTIDAVGAGLMAGALTTTVKKVQRTLAG